MWKDGRKREKSRILLLNRRSFTLDQKLFGPELDVNGDEKLFEEETKGTGDQRNGNDWGMEMCNEVIHERTGLLLFKLQV